MPSIRVLPESVANKIAAGEVVERPASVIKELVENALDADAGRVRVTIEGGGKRLIRVEDDGSGIAAEEVKTAFERHATSKLRAAEDLEHIATLGFRGEALPSIASVSRLALTTLARGEEGGTRIEIAGGKTEVFEPAPFSPGTTVEVRDLFYNLPARLKFLKATAAETAAASQVVVRAALARPDVHVILVSNGRERFSCPPAKSARERVGQLFGAERGERLLEASGEDGRVELLALADLPERHVANRNEQYLFLNGRSIVDRSLQQATQRAYEGLVPGGRFASVFLYLTLPPDIVDVNVHPAKSEVRFVEARPLQSLVRRTLSEALSQASYVPSFDGARAERRNVREAVESFMRPASPPAETSAPAAPAPEAAASSTPSSRRPPAGGATEHRGGRSAGAAASIPAASGGAAPARSGPGGSAAGGSAAGGSARSSTAACSETQATASLPYEPGLRVLGQFRRTFIVASDERGLVLADQHTAHERVLYEKLQRDRGGPGDVQRLLIPQVVEVPGALAAALDDAATELAELGVEVEAMGGSSVAVRALPVGVSPGEAKDLVLDCLGAVTAGGEGLLARRRDRLLATVACHAAVKVNMELERTKMEWILRELMRTVDPYKCPHGRATILRMGDDAVRKGFKRYW